MLPPVPMSATLYHCPCIPSTSLLAYHPLPSLYFCEECDSVRCPECVTEEVSSYYCPNCLFEVPQASVRAEKNRCARNCFTCPCCTNTLSVVATDPTSSSSSDPPAPSSTSASIGEPPYYLSCLSCRWDSKAVGIVFEKPTGLAGQLTKLDEASPALVEYEGIREHVEPYFRAGLAASSSNGGVGNDKTSSSGSARGSHPTNAIAAAARALSHSSSTMMKDIPSSIASANRFNSLHNLAMMHRSSSSKTGLSSIAASGSIPSSTRDHLSPYISPQGKKGKGKEMVLSVEEDEKKRVEQIKSIKKVQDLAALQQRWTNTYNQALLSKELRPQRIPLQSKRTKRCHVCRHIVVKPDPKAASTKFKIRLVATSYLPQIDVHRRVPPSLNTRLSDAGSATPAARRSGRVSSTTTGTLSTNAAGAKETLIPVGSDQDSAEPLRPGRNYSYQLTFVNPLYEAIEVLVEMVEPVSESDEDEDEGDGEEEKKATKGTEQERVEKQKERQNGRKKKNYSTTMPGTSFSINAFAEAWEYEGQDEDEDDLLSTDAGGEEGIGANSTGRNERRKRLSPGVLAQRANRTVVQLDLVTGREAVGLIRIPLYITYTYTAEDVSLPSTGKDKDKTVTTAASVDPDTSATNNLKSFSFWTSVMLGTVVPRTVPGGSTLADRVGSGVESRRIPSGWVAGASGAAAAAASVSTSIAE